MGRLQDLRDRYGIASPAPVCVETQSGQDPECQVVVVDGNVSVGNGGEIKLTYGQLSSLVDEAVRQLASTRAHSRG